MKTIVHSQSIQSALNAIKMVLEMRFGQPVIINSSSVRETDSSLPGAGKKVFKNARTVTFTVNFSFQDSLELQTAKGEIWVEEYQPRYMDGAPSNFKRWNLSWSNQGFFVGEERISFSRKDLNIGIPGVRVLGPDYTQFVGCSVFDRQIMPL